MIPEMVNILVIRSTSTTYDKDHLLEAINLMEQAVEQGDDSFFSGMKLGGKKKIEGVQDFVEKMRNLSGVFFKTAQRIQRGKLVDEAEYCLLWGNDQAENQIPEELRTFFNRVYPRS
jgi:hypothetical protein